MTASPRLAEPGRLAPPPECRAQIADWEWIAARAAAWDRLVEEAESPNAHFGRRVMGAHRAHALAGGDLRFLVLSSGDRLRAVLPFRPVGTRLGLTARASVPFTSPYITDSTPLVAKAGLEELVEALADALAAVAPPSGLWRFPLLATGTPVGRALLAAIARRGWPHEIVGAFLRAVLDRRGSFEAVARMQAGRTKDLRRRRKRLGERGLLEHRAHERGPGLDEAVEAFLDLERAGWKGARRTALASRPHTAVFARALFGAGEPGPVRPRADLLSLDGRPIAVSLALVCGGTASLLKTTYDETLRTFAPGLLLEEDIIRAMHEERFARRLDSASLAGSVLDGFYPDREPIADIVVACGSTWSSGELARLVERQRRLEAGIAQAKDLVRSVRGR